MDIMALLQPLLQAQLKYSQNKGPLSGISSTDVNNSNVAGIADALMGGAQDPVAQGNENAGGFMTSMGGKPGLSYMLSSIGSALSARDPNSWQHQLSNTTMKSAQTGANARVGLITDLQQKIQPPVAGALNPQVGLYGPKQSILGSLVPDFKSALGG